MANQNLQTISNLTQENKAFYEIKPNHNILCFKIKTLVYLVDKCELECYNL